MRLLVICSFYFCLLASCIASPKVAVSITPIYSIICGLMEGAGEPKLLFDERVSPHKANLRPRDIQALRSADLVVWIGPQIESAMEKVLSTHVSPNKQLSLINIKNIKKILRSDDSHHGCGVDSHDHSGGVDPHIWLSINNMRVIIEEIADRLEKLDPKNLNHYRSNKKRTLKELDNLEEYINSKLLNISTKPYMVFHQAYRYFEEDYKLNNMGALITDPHKSPSLYKLQQIKLRIGFDKVSCVFAEANTSRSTLDKLASTTGIKVGILDPIGIEFMHLKSRAYYIMMQKLADTFAECLSK